MSAVNAARLHQTSLSFILQMEDVTLQTVKTVSCEKVWDGYESALMCWQRLLNGPRVDYLIFGLL